MEVAKLSHSDDAASLPKFPVSGAPSSGDPTGTFHQFQCLVPTPLNVGTGSYCDVGYYDRVWSYPRTMDTLPGDFIASNGSGAS